MSRRVLGWFAHVCLLGGAVWLAWDAWECNEFCELGSLVWPASAVAAYLIGSVVVALTTERVSAVFGLLLLTLVIMTIGFMFLDLSAGLPRARWLWLGVLAVLPGVILGWEHFGRAPEPVEQDEDVSRQ